MSASRTPSLQTHRRNVLAILRDALLGTWDRTFAFISVVVSVLSLLVSVYLLKFPGEIPQLIVLRDLIVVFVLIAWIVLLIFQNAHRQSRIENQRKYIEQLQSDLSSQAEESSQIVSNYKREIFSHFLKRISQPSAFHLTRRDLKSFEHVCRETTNGIRESFLRYFKSRGIDVGEDVSVSVKLVVPSQMIAEVFKHLDESSVQQVQKKDRWVVTVFRDYFTYSHHGEREVNLRLYDVERNTAFINIVLNGERFFWHNDLQSMGSTYLNENPHWKESYNSTLVVPIRYHDEASNSPKCFGLLAVDSLNSNKIELYNDTDCYYRLSHSADLLATFFLSLALLRSQPPTD